ncbi:hypothetical protein [Pectobacterium wasabiae]|nr:hypothetical protein [Pectobacterium wasabiae]
MKLSSAFASWCSSSVAGGASGFWPGVTLRSACGRAGSSDDAAQPE